MEQSYDLVHPVTISSRAIGEGVKQQVIDSVSLRRPKARDLRAIDKVEGQMAQGIAMICALTGQPSHVIDELDAEDFQALAEMVGNFFPGRPKTGEAS